MAVGLFDAKVVGKDPRSDIALIQIQEPKNLTAIKLPTPMRCASVITPWLSATRSVWAKP